MKDVGDLARRIDEEEAEGLAKPIRILLMVTLLSILPGLLLMGTSFTRIVIVLAFIRRALTTRQIPPAPVVIGLALFLSVFVMSPTMSEMNRTALQPYIRGEMEAQTALEVGMRPLRQFMLGQTGQDELALFVSMSSMQKRPATPADLPTHVLVPAFVTSELKKAFELGFVLYLPFLVLDLVVASVLLSMGMMMLPPVIVSAPLKILLFVLVDGWSLVTQSLVLSFGGG
jgi:flagellar biosynthetic protein FliP